MAEIPVVSALISGAQAILQGLIPLAQQQISIEWGFEKNLKKLHTRLTMIEALLGEVAKRRTLSEPMRVWLKGLDAVTSDAENLLDELKYEDIRRKVEVQNRKRKEVRDFLSSHNQVAFRHRMANKVNDINLSLDGVYERAKEIGLNPASQDPESSGSKHMDFRLTGPYIGDVVAVGREDDVSKVIEMVRSSDMDDNLSITAIVGMAGLGKTTLAKLIYKHEKVVGNFLSNRMWICVSDNFNVVRLLNEMVESLTKAKSDLQNIEAIVQTLGRQLNGKKYLLVLDDVWNRSEGKWQHMRNCLLGIGGSKGSKVIVTTRDMDVVSTMQISHSLTHRLSGLSHKDSLTMFEKKVFAEGGPTKTQSLLSTGERMVRKCKGVPLAINALGGILWSKKYESDWLNVEKNGIWSSLGDSNDIVPVLRISFDDLPSPSLKHCFAYCSVFPKDKIIIRDELIQMWMALSYLQPPLRTNIEAEDVGNDYFKILLHRSLFQEAELDDNGNITSCKMHDLVHDLALNVSEGNCLNLENNEMEDYPDFEGKHLWLGLAEKTSLKFSKENVGKVRTLFSFCLPQNIEDVKCIRVCSVKILESPISKFIHLKYLDLSMCSCDEVPDFLCMLYNLETLRLPYVRKFPKEFHKLVSMRHLYMESRRTSEEFPVSIGVLTSLQTLTYFVVGDDEGHKIEELGRLTKLRGKLKIYNLQKVENREEAERANMVEKNIEELEYNWDNSVPHVEHKEVLEGLKPHKNLRGLTLEGFGGLMLASWMRTGDAQSLQHLVKINLNNCSFCEQVPPLGHLPSLEIVGLYGLNNVRRIGSEFYGLGEGIYTNTSRRGEAAARAVFPSLRKLTLNNMRNLEEWSEISNLPPAATSTEEFFPLLENLFISSCPRLITIPGNSLSFKSITVTIIKVKDESNFDRGTSYVRSLEICTISDSDNILILLEDLLANSSKFLRSLKIVGLDELHYFPTQFRNLTSLEELLIWGCCNLRSFCEDTELAVFNRLKSLEKLNIDACRQLIVTDSNEFRSLTSLQDLTIWDCPGLNSCFGKGLFCLSNIRRLTIFPGDAFYESDPFAWPSTSTGDAANVQGVQQCPFFSLETLRLWNDKKHKHLPDQLQHLTALKELVIIYFKELEALPDWLCNLSSLQSLHLWNCRNLMSLPSLEAIKRLTNLQKLKVIDCPQITKQFESGELGCKNALIPSVTIRGDRTWDILDSD